MGERRYSHYAHSLAPVNVVARQGRKIEHVLQELGADEVIDYTTQRFEDALKSNPVDAVIDPVGGELQERSQLRHVHPFPFHFWREILYSIPSLSMPASINHNLRVRVRVRVRKPCSKLKLMVLSKHCNECMQDLWRRAAMQC